MCAAMLSHTSPLRPLLYDLVKRAQDRPNTPHSLYFDNQILVEVICKNGKVHLNISREDKLPTLEEYWDILSCWPYENLARNRPRAIIQRDRKILTSIWPRLAMPSY